MLIVLRILLISLVLKRLHIRSLQAYVSAYNLIMLLLRGTLYIYKSMAAMQLFLQKCYRIVMSFEIAEAHLLQLDKLLVGIHVGEQLFRYAA